MPYTGNKPSAVPLTSADIADSIITSAKIVDGTIANADINSSAAITYSKLSLGTSIVNADISASAAIASTKLSGVNDAKAWVNFNGTGTIATRASYNVSSLTDVATGTYRVNFTTAMTDANYCNVASVNYDATTATGSSIGVDRGSQTTTYMYLEVRSAAQTADVDRAYIHAAVFR